MSFTEIRRSILYSNSIILINTEVICDLSWSCFSTRMGLEQESGGSQEMETVSINNSFEKIACKGEDADRP